MDLQPPVLIGGHDVAQAVHTPELRPSTQVGYLESEKFTENQHDLRQADHQLDHDTVGQQVDMDLINTMRVWPRLPKHIRDCILQLIRSFHIEDRNIVE